ncbi:MAG TPA: PAS domain S-box protein, partial [Flavitalea sp.]|nr:PAS domain S-box protein [Flavitalea sp.]
DAINSGKAWDLELQIITAKGNERWARVMGEAEMKNGRCVRLYGTLQDIHERKKAEETVRESYEEKISILESIGDAFFAVDRKGTVTYWNNIAENVMGMAREKILGKNLWEVYGDAVSLKFHTEYEKAMKGNVAVHFEEFYPPLNLWLEVSIYPSASGLSIYFRDITGQKKTIREITNQNETLMEIAWIQSHEVRAPLARMMGLINLINDRLERETELPELLARIQSSAVELDGIIKKIVRKTEAMEKK